MVRFRYAIVLRCNGCCGTGLSTQQPPSLYDLHTPCQLCGGKGTVGEAQYVDGEMDTADDKLIWDFTGNWSTPL